MEKGFIIKSNNLFFPFRDSRLRSKLNKIEDLLSRFSHSLQLQSITLLFLAPVKPSIEYPIAKLMYLKILILCLNIS